MVPFVTPNVFPQYAASAALTTTELSAPQQPATPPQPRKPRLWTIFATWLLANIGGLFASILAFLIAGIAIGAVLGFQGVEPAAIQARVVTAFQNPMLALLLTIVPYQLGMGLVVVLVARRSKQPLRERLGLLPQAGRPVGKLTMLGLAGFTLSAAMAVAIGSSMLLGNPAANVIGNAIVQDSLLAVTIVSILLSLLPAVVEEVVFRGFIQRRLLERWSPKVAIGVSTLLFAIIHADSLQHILAVIPLGLVTGMLAYRTGSVKAGIVVHALHNGGLVAVVTLLRLLGPAVSEDVAGMIVLGGGSIMVLGGLVALVALLRKGPAADLTPATPDMLAEVSLGQAA